MTNVCVFGCSGSASDSLEHYCKCPVVLQVIKRKLRVEVSQRAALRFFMLDFARSDDNMLRCGAIINYAVYNTFNAFRSNSITRSMAVSSDALGQAILNALMGHPASEEFVRNRWAAAVTRGPNHPND